MGKHTKSSSNSKASPSDKLYDDAIAQALKNYPHSTTSKAEYYLEITNGKVAHPLVIPPIGKSDAERLRNAEGILDRIFRSDRSCPFKLKPSSHEHTFRVKEDDKPVTFTFRRREAEFEPLDAPIGTIFIVGAAILALLDKYALSQIDEDVSPIAPPRPAAASESDGDDLEQASFSEEEEEESSIISVEDEDEDLKVLSRELNEIKNKRKIEAEEAGKLKTRESKVARLAVKIREEQKALGELQKENDQVKNRIQTQLTDAKALTQVGMFKAPAKPAASPKGALGDLAKAAESLPAAVGTPAAAGTPGTPRK